MHLFRLPLIRLLAFNFAIGVAVAGVMLGGLLALNPGNLRGLLFADSGGGAAFTLLAFGLVVTFASAAMGSAIMALGRPSPPMDGGGRLQPAKARLRQRA
jgi:hypothetical protein